ncbi:MAG: dTDP-4-dehydrorhamnose 3,5-epimerase [Polaromonas sp.]|nr:dTDP-4-dehydrorhamnose 3,5-epimerase [Polaromonas sp.]
MKVMPSALPGVLLIEPRVMTDERGFFYESFHAQRFAQLTGVTACFVQDNFSRSSCNVLRGLHYQVQHVQGKLVQVMAGEIFDVAVDLRQSSPNFGRWVGCTLSAANRQQHWIPPGFAHGFLVTSASADVLYKTTAYYAPEYERSIRWDDAAISIPWPLQGQPTLSAKDTRAELLKNADLFL